MSVLRGAVVPGRFRYKRGVHVREGPLLERCLYDCIREAFPYQRYDHIREAFILEI